MQWIYADHTVKKRHMKTLRMYLEVNKNYYYTVFLLYFTPSSPNPPIPFGICCFRLFLWHLPQTELRIISVPIENTGKHTVQPQESWFYSLNTEQELFISYLIREAQSWFPQSCNAIRRCHKRPKIKTKNLQSTAWCLFYAQKCQEQI